MVQIQAVNARDKNFTEAKMKHRLSGSTRASRLPGATETADRHGDRSEVKVARLKDKIGN